MSDLLVKVDSEVTSSFPSFEVNRMQAILSNGLYHSLGIDVKALKDFLPDELKSRSVQGDFARYIGAKEIEGSVGVVWTPNTQNDSQTNWFKRLKEESYKGLLVVYHSTPNGSSNNLKEACKYADETFGALEMLSLISFLREKISK